MTKWRAYKRRVKALQEQYARKARRPINVRCFLPPLDGEHDDAPALQAAIDFVAKYGGGPVGLSDTLTITRGSRIQGHGLGRTVLMPQEDERA